MSNRGDERMHTVKVMASTTRLNRKAILRANWILEVVRQDKEINVELLDVAAVVEKGFTEEVDVI